MVYNTPIYFWLAHMFPSYFFRGLQLCLGVAASSTKLSRSNSSSHASHRECINTFSPFKSLTFVIQR
jgi:hypothetical protein